MPVLKVPLKDAENVKNLLKEKKHYDYEFIPEKTNQEIFFPVTSKGCLNYVPKGKISRKALKKIEKAKSYKDHLEGKLTKKEIASLPTAYDIIGDILVTELKDTRYEKDIGEALLRANKNIKTVLKKADIHKGEFRTQNLKHVVGEKKKETICRENNVMIKLDVEKIYFSPRLSTERKRISQQVKKGETILVMFSGCAPYPLVISKNTESKKIVGIEKNPIAHKYAVENLKLNKVYNVTLINGDVREEVPLLKEKFDRILMPLPKGAEDFLYLAFSVSKKKTTIHFYDFEHENELMNGEKKVNFGAKKAGKQVKITGTVKCGQYSPGKFRICVDFVVL